MNREFIRAASLPRLDGHGQITIQPYTLATISHTSTSRGTTEYTLVLPQGDSVRLTEANLNYYTRATELGLPLMAQGRDVISVEQFKVGDEVCFTRHYLNAPRGMTGRVVAASALNLTIQLANGHPITIGESLLRSVDYNPVQRVIVIDHAAQVGDYVTTPDGGGVAASVGEGLVEVELDTEAEPQEYPQDEVQVAVPGLVDVEKARALRRLLQLRAVGEQFRVTKDCTARLWNSEDLLDLLVDDEVVVQNDLGDGTLEAQALLGDGTTETIEVTRQWLRDNTEAFVRRTARALPTVGEKVIRFDQWDIGATGTVNREMGLWAWPTDAFLYDPGQTIAFTEPGDTFTVVQIAPDGGIIFKLNGVTDDDYYGYIHPSDENNESYYTLDYRSLPQAARRFPNPKRKQVKRRAVRRITQSAPPKPVLPTSPQPTLQPVLRMAARQYLTLRSGPPRRYVQALRAVQTVNFATGQPALIRLGQVLPVWEALHGLNGEQGVALGTPTTPYHYQLTAQDVQTHFRAYDMPEDDVDKQRPKATGQAFDLLAEIAQYCYNNNIGVGEYGIAMTDFTAPDEDYGTLWEAGLFDELVLEGYLEAAPGQAGLYAITDKGVGETNFEVAESTLYSARQASPFRPTGQYTPYETADQWMVANGQWWNVGDVLNIDWLQLVDPDLQVWYAEHPTEADQDYDFRVDSIELSEDGAEVVLGLTHVSSGIKTEATSDDLATRSTRALEALQGGEALWASPEEAQAGDPAAAVSTGEAGDAYTVTQTNEDGSAIYQVAAADGTLYYGMFSAAEKAEEATMMACPPDDDPTKRGYANITAGSVWQAPPFDSAIEVWGDEDLSEPLGEWSVTAGDFLQMIKPDPAMPDAWIAYVQGSSDNGQPLYTAVSAQRLGANTGWQQVRAIDPGLLVTGEPIAAQVTADGMLSDGTPLVAGAWLTLTGRDGDTFTGTWQADDSPVTLTLDDLALFDMEAPDVAPSDEA